ncbi:M20/M25/M40 family metallo-hydrolase [Candidatus Woesearchaeota archaeon]|nr:M20/M25/M40 family metallo-hydrolase [Candidatus Woesearchaeota archaeon]
MKEIVRLTSDMIRFETTADKPEEIRKCADYIMAYLRGHGIVVKKFEKNKKISIAATYRRTRSPKIFLNAHFDVVPASRRLFSPKVKSGKLYGRGSEDCKVQVAVLMKIMKDMAALKPDIGIMLTSDEEVHGHDGVRYLLSENGYSAEFAIVADGGDNFDIVTKHKGVLQVKLSAKGRSAHASRYWEGGENAIEKLIAAYSKVQKIFPKLTKPEWKTTANLSKISGGDALNKVPDYAELYLDIRRTEKDAPQDIMKKLQSIEGIQVEKVADADMLITNENNPYIRQLQKSAEKILKRKVRTYHEHGATDARYFCETGIPAVLFKTIGFGAHSENEHVVISSIEPYYNILADFIRATAK